MKARGLVVIDYEFEGGFMQAAAEQEKLTKAIEELVSKNKAVTFYDVDMRERRGDKKPDLKKVKVRN